MEGGGKEEELGDIMLRMLFWRNSPGNVNDPGGLALSSNTFIRVSFQWDNTQSIFVCPGVEWEPGGSSGKTQEGKDRGYVGAADTYQWTLGLKHTIYSQ